MYRSALLNHYVHGVQNCWNWKQEWNKRERYKFSGDSGEQRMVIWLENCSNVVSLYRNRCCKEINIGHTHHVKCVCLPRATIVLWCMCRVYIINCNVDRPDLNLLSCKFSDCTWWVQRNIGVARILSGCALFPQKIDDFLVVAFKRRSKTTNWSSKYFPHSKNVLKIYSCSALRCTCCAGGALTNFPVNYA